MSTHSLNLGGVISEAKRIISAHSRHFLALSVLFLLPLSFSIIVYPFLSQPTSILSSYNKITLPDRPRVAIPVLHAVFVLLFTLFASASITYSTFHGFYGRPVKFVSSMKSILFSFFPLLATVSIAAIFLGLVCFVVGFIAWLAVNGLLLFGFEIDYEGVFFMVIAISIAVLLVCSVICLFVDWYLTIVIVVVESKWGFEPLKRSSYLMKGMKNVGFFMILLFGLGLGLMSFSCSMLVPTVFRRFRWAPDGAGWAGRFFLVVVCIVQAVVMTLWMLYAVASNVVLFMYCKALHGELALDIAHEFSCEYVSLPFDDGKVPHVVYIA
ncbi:hypothetical protein F511_27652 [Dorcoceras hygrometricum]|uniref:Uncharacterized protein n=1 Tax=Dorcoceras hygrometricum TaxID=472368 RepID=A0A2Z7ADZ8_9LAMI|nr:hypothetical protein F511_27652 [Dorcoceras hygrometricum]